MDDYISFNLVNTKNSDGCKVQSLWEHLLYSTKHAHSNMKLRRHFSLLSYVPVGNVGTGLFVDLLVGCGCGGGCGCGCG